MFWQNVLVCIKNRVPKVFHENGNISTSCARQQNNIRLLIHELKRLNRATVSSHCSCIEFQHFSNYKVRKVY